MKLSSVLTSIKGSNSEKTASAAPSQGDKTSAATTGDKLKQALKEATAPAQQEKQAAAVGTSPVEGLTKIAEQVASAEHEALVKEANLYGAAVCDGFMARAAQYEAAGHKLASTLTVNEIRPQLAAVKTAGDDSFEKFASENPALIKEAAELGYQTTLQQVDKLAQAAYAKGSDDGTLAVYKLGHACFVQGFEDTANLLREIAK